MNDISKKSLFEHELTAILTPKITQYLPQSMQLSAERGSIAQWVTDRVNEAEVLCVHSRDQAELVGLVILANDPGSTKIPTFHLGYFLGENDWGKGYATELVTALVAYFENGPQIRFVAGVDSDNTASAKVLEKSGFKIMTEQSTAGRDFFEYTV